MPSCLNRGFVLTLPGNLGRRSGSWSRRVPPTSWKTPRRRRRPPVAPQQGAPAPWLVRHDLVVQAHAAAAAHLQPPGQQEQVPQEVWPRTPPRSRRCGQAGEPKHGPPGRRRASDPAGTACCRWRQRTSSSVSARLTKIWIVVGIQPHCG